MRTARGRRCWHTWHPIWIDGGTSGPCVRRRPRPGTWRAVMARRDRRKGRMMDLADAQAALAGAMISVATPTTGDFTLDLAAYRRNLRFMVERGVRRGNGVLLVAAAGGEFPMLTTEERKTLMRVAVETVGDVVPIAASLQS